MVSAGRDTVPAIVVNEVSHSFKATQALNRVSFCVLPGSIHGFVGPNGAGKTTTLRTICTLLRPARGEIKVFGSSTQAAPEQIRRRIGYMPDHFSMYRQMTVFEYLDFFAAAYGLELKERDRAITDLLDLTDMAGRRDSLIGGLSRGMQQRVGLARVLVHDPDLLLLDEPASGLDPRARIELTGILRELRRMGKTIFISSHILSELAELCDAVTIIDRGEIRFSGPMRILEQQQGAAAVWNLQLSRLVDGLLEKLEALSLVTTATEVEFSDGYVFQLVTDMGVTASQLLQQLLPMDLPIISFGREKRHLNEAFMDLTTEGVR